MDDYNKYFLKKDIINSVLYNIKLSNIYTCKMHIEKIYDDECTCFSNNDLKIKRLINSYVYISMNVSRPINNELIAQIFYLLNNEIVDVNLSEKIIEMYYQNRDQSIYYIASLIHLFIINNIKLRNNEFAFLISSLIFLKHNKRMIVLYDVYREKYEKIIINNNLSKLILFLYQVEKKFPQKNLKKISFNDIVCVIKKNKKSIISRFNVLKLYLFGSFAKRTNNENSDIDFLVILDENLINIERLEQISLLKEYLSKLFECSVDVLDFTFALKELGENEIEHIITLI